MEFEGHQRVCYSCWLQKYWKLAVSGDSGINLENIEVQWQCWQCFCSALMVKYQFTPAMSIIYLAYISYNLSYNLSVEPLSSIRVMHPTIYPNINFSTWRQGFCVSLWSVGKQRAARLEKIIPLFGAKLSHRKSHHLFSPWNLPYLRGGSWWEN